MRNSTTDISERNAEISAEIVINIQSFNRVIESVLVRLQSDCSRLELGASSVGYFKSFWYDHEISYILSYSYTHLSKMEQLRRQLWRSNNLKQELQRLSENLNRTYRGLPTIHNRIKSCLELFDEEISTFCFCESLICYGVDSLEPRGENTQHTDDQTISIQTI